MKIEIYLISEALDLIRNNTNDLNIILEQTKLINRYSNNLIKYYCEIFDKDKDSY